MKHNIFNSDKPMIAVGLNNLAMKQVLDLLAVRPPGF